MLVKPCSALYNWVELRFTFPDVENHQVRASDPQPRATITKKVMISSTARDLPEHRELVKEACLRLGLFPIMIEHLLASEADAIAETMRMVNEADLLLGIYAYRYGYIPRGFDISIIEMEYNRASERGIPRLIFFMHQDHPLKVSDVERGEGAVRVDVFKARVQTAQVVNFFRSPQELQAQVINALSNYRQTSQFPFWLMEPELIEDIKIIEHSPGSAVFQAVRRLEIIIRKIGNYPAGLIGQKLINEAMRDGGLLKPQGATDDERQAWANLFRGAIGAFKNPESHRDQSLNLIDAMGQILAVNVLLRKLKQDFPQKFKKENQTGSADDEK